MSGEFHRERLSEHFSRSEFECHCGCGFDEVDPELIEVLEGVRREFGGSPVRITSGCRCPRHNFEVGGSTYSQHQHGIAADIQVSGVDPAFVAEYLNSKYPDKYGIGRYPGWTHIDVRQYRARW